MARKNTAVRSEAAPTYGNSEPSVEAENALIAQAMSILDGRIKGGDALSDPAVAGRYLKLRLQPNEREVFAALFLDTRHQVLAYEELFLGSVDGAEVHPREVVKAALRANAAAVIVGHNHPSGSANPSSADRVVTTRLKQALALVDVRLLDHFVVGVGEPVSMAARGMV